MTPIASSPSRIGTPRYDRHGVPTIADSASTSTLLSTDGRPVCMIRPVSPSPGAIGSWVKRLPGCRSDTGGRPTASAGPGARRRRCRPGTPGASARRRSRRGRRGRARRERLPDVFTIVSSARRCSSRAPAKRSRAPRSGARQGPQQPNVGVGEGVLAVDVLKRDGACRLAARIRDTDRATGRLPRKLVPIAVPLRLDGHVFVDEQRSPRFPSLF